MRNSLSCLVLFLVLACAGDQTSPVPAARAIRDSAGVQIVEVSVEITSVTALDSPAVRIGVPEGDERYQLYQVRGVRALPDTSILLLNAGTQELRRYSAQGEWLGSYGRRGSGPGEMQYPVALYVTSADTSVVLDFSVRGFHVIGPDGTIARTQRLDTSVSGFVGLLDSVTVVVAPPEFPRGIYSQVLAGEVTVSVVGVNTSRIDTLVTLPAFQQYSYTHGELVRSLPVPFTVMPAIAAREGHVYISDGINPEVRIYNRQGQLTRIVRLPFAPAPLEDAEWDRTVDMVLEARSGITRGESRLSSQELATQREIYDRMTRPQTKPVFDRISLNEPGRIWLRQFQPPGQPQQWVGVDVEGQTITVVHVPARINVRDIRTDWVLGQEVDSMGVEYIVRHATAKRN